MIYESTFEKFLTGKIQIELTKRSLYLELIEKIYHEEREIKKKFQNLNEYEIKKLASKKANFEISKKLKNLQIEENKLLYS